MVEIVHTASTDRIEQLHLYVQLRPHIIAVPNNGIEGPARVAIAGPDELIARLKIEEERGRALMVTEEDNAPGYTIKWGEAARKLTTTRQAVVKVVSGDSRLTIGCVAGNVTIDRSGGLSAGMINGATALDLAGEAGGLTVKLFAPGPFSFKS